MPEVLGNFNPTEAVVYADDPVAAQLAANADDGDTGAQAGERESQDPQLQDRKVADESMIRRKARRSSEPPAPAQKPAEPAKPERRGLVKRSWALIQLPSFSPSPLLLIYGTLLRSTTQRILHR